MGETVPVEDVAQPIDFRSPETFLTGKFDHRHDIWRAGCVMFVLFYQRPPFFVYLSDSHFYLRRMIRKLGPLPEHWLPKFDELRKETIYTQEVGKWERKHKIFVLIYRRKRISILTFDYRRKR